MLQKDSGNLPFFLSTIMLCRCVWSTRWVSQTSQAGKLSRAKLADSMRLHQELKRAVALSDEQTLVKELEQAEVMAKNNILKPRDYATVLNVVTKAKQSQETLNRINSIVAHFNARTRKSPSFLSSLTPIDIVQAMNAIAKLSKVQGQKSPAALSRLLETLAELVPSKISLFEDHHLALILHATRAKQADLIPTVCEVVTEISQRRDLSTFSGQSVVMIASALSKFEGGSKTQMHQLWTALVKRSLELKPSDFQPGWASVIVTSLANAASRPIAIPQQFIEFMQTQITREFQSGYLDNDRMASSTKSLTVLNQCKKENSQ